MPREVGRKRDKNVVYAVISKLPANKKECSEKKKQDTKVKFNKVLKAKRNSTNLPVRIESNL